MAGGVSGGAKTGLKSGLKDNKLANLIVVYRNQCK